MQAKSNYTACRHADNGKGENIAANSKADTFPCGNYRIIVANHCYLLPLSHCSKVIAKLNLTGMSVIFCMQIQIISQYQIHIIMADSQF